MRDEREHPLALKVQTIGTDFVMFLNLVARGEDAVEYPSTPLSISPVPPPGDF